MYTALTELLVPTADADVGAFRAAFVAETRLLLAASPESASSSTRTAGDLAADLCDRGRAHHRPGFFSTLHVSETIGEFTQSEVEALASTLVELLHDGPERVRALLVRMDEGTSTVGTGVSLDRESRRGRRSRTRLVGTNRRRRRRRSACGERRASAHPRPLGRVALAVILVVLLVSIAAQVRQLR